MLGIGTFISQIVSLTGSGNLGTRCREASADILKVAWEAAKKLDKELEKATKYAIVNMIVQDYQDIIQLMVCIFQSLK